MIADEQDFIPAPSLTQRERDCLLLAAQGFNNREIGRELGLTEKTIRGYFTVILSKLDVTNRTHAVVCAWWMGLIAPPALDRASLPHFQILGLDGRRARDAEIVRMHQAGTSLRRICTYFGLSLSRVKCIVAREGHR